ncbi:sn-glycerol-3-phosphate transport system permease protein [Paracoccus aminophilus JCM 7686]|uniref:sn-glycerol-3-phosphate transport system permease protein n=2 Tax=Paracoccus aminophilus TaxID=34003 RepID=S5YTN8_PARAH|nr:sn-glycerol-3-phosphate transport system permease protein [Paracoccus aminophilus JCM 7686]
MRTGLMKTLAPWIFVGPAVVAVIVFLYGPMIASLVLSFLDWNLLSPDVGFAGTRHYQAVAASHDFRLSAWNTLLYCLVLIPAQILLPLGFALMIHGVRGSRMGPIYRGALFLPTIVAYSVAGVAWSWLLNPVNGLFNEVLSALGLPRSRWHTDPQLALLCVSLVTFWKSFGLNMLLWLAALTTVPQSLIEAARLDGARPRRIFFNITLPLISPTAFFIAVTTLFSVLDDIVGVVDVLTGGGPAGSSSNLLYYLWQQGLGFFQFGQASAVAMILIVAVLLVTWAQFALVERKVHYE